MENYLCVNGEKFDLTDEQVECIKTMITPKCLLGDVGVGETFRLGKHEFILCEHLEDGKAVVLLKDLLFENKQFGSNNNYDGSNVDGICNKFADEMGGLVGGALCEFSLNLTADDGLKCYGSVERKAALLTANMCRKYVETLDKYKIDKWWWTSTAYSTPKHDDSSWIKCVSPLGYVDNDFYDGNYGVRPFCILKSNIFVSK